MALQQIINSAVRILIVDDHPIVREGLSSLLSKQPDFQVCGEADDMQSALALVDESHPHVLIIDISLKKGSGLDLIRRIMETDRSIRMVVCSLHDDTLYAERALKAGALGYVNKHEATLTIVTAIRQILTGKMYVSERMSERLTRRLIGSGPTKARYGIEALSERELQVFELIGAGLTTVEIARRLNLGVKTIETHRRRIKEKLNIMTSAQLAREAAQWTLEHN